VSPAASRIEVVAAVLRRQDLVLAARRPPGKARAGCWEFPGGKVEPGESQPEALRRELLEELALEVEVGSHLLSIEHDYDDLHLRLHAYLCRSHGEPLAREHVELRWLTVEELLEVSWSEADRVLAEVIHREMGRTGM
jgi:mutator protein MutT